MNVKRKWKMFAIFTVVWAILYIVVNPTFKNAVLPISYVEAEVISKNVGIRGKRTLYFYCVFNSNNHTMVRDCSDDYVIGEKYSILTDEYMISKINYINWLSFYWFIYGIIAFMLLFYTSIYYALKD